MKERILKLCKRLDKFSFDEISLIADDVNKSVLELILLTLESEKYLKREDILFGVSQSSGETRIKVPSYQSPVRTLFLGCR